MKVVLSVAALVALIVVVAALGNHGSAQPSAAISTVAPAPSGSFFKYTVQAANSVAINYSADSTSAAQSVYGGPIWTAYAPREANGTQTPSLSATGSDQSGTMTCSISDETGRVLVQSTTTVGQMAVTCDVEPPVTTASPTTTEAPQTEAPNTDSGSSSSGGGDDDHHHHVHVCAGHHVRICS